jgi:hypothetical protein
MSKHKRSAPQSSESPAPAPSAFVDYASVVSGFDIQAISCSAPVRLNFKLGAPNSYALRGCAADLPMVAFDFSGAGALRLFWNGPAGSAPSSEIICELSAPAPDTLHLLGECRASVLIEPEAPDEFKIIAAGRASAACSGSLSKIKLMGSDSGSIDATALRAGSVLAIASGACSISAWAIDRINADLDGNAHFAFRCSGEATVWAKDSSRAEHLSGALRKASFELRGHSRASAIRIDGKALLRAQKDCSIFYSARENSSNLVEIDSQEGSKIRHLPWVEEKPASRMADIADSAHRARAQIAALAKETRSRA